MKVHAPRRPAWVWVILTLPRPEKAAGGRALGGGCGAGGQARRGVSCLIRLRVGPAIWNVVRKAVLGPPGWPAPLVDLGDGGGPPRRT